MPATETWTVGRLLQWTTGYLASRGADSPRLDAEVLLARVRGCERIQLYVAFEEIPDEATRTAFRELVKQRAEGMPVAYLVGRREFYSLSFRVTRDVLIPRPETELAVVRLIDLAEARTTAGQPPTIADVGTGSGIIAICAARRLPTSRVVAIDICARALAVCASNVAEHGLTERIELVESDLFARLDRTRRFDFIVSNPPYVTTAELQQLARDVRDFEPHLALAAGARGLDVIERLLPEAAERLNAGGTLLMELSPQLAADVTALVGADPRWETATILKDHAAQPRLLEARRK